MEKFERKSYRTSWWQTSTSCPHSRFAH